MIEASPEDAQLYRLRALEAEAMLDFEAAEQDWQDYAAIVADPAEGQSELADFYQRRLRPVDEVEALMAVGRGPATTSERFTPPAEQRSWKAFERVIETVERHLLPDRLTSDTYRAWIGRYPDQGAVYRRYLEFLIADGRAEGIEQLVAEGVLNRGRSDGYVPPLSRLWRGWAGVEARSLSAPPLRRRGGSAVMNGPRLGAPRASRGRSRPRRRSKSRPVGVRRLTPTAGVRSCPVACD